MKNKLFLFFSIVLFPITIFSQQNIIISGKIFDATTKKPISFASIYYKYGGTISGEFGVFRVADAWISDTLRISCIGYKNKYIPVSDLKTNDWNIVFMDKHVYKLSEVKVEAKKKRLGAIQIIKNALRRIEYNYPTNPVLYNGYYREYLMQNNQYFNLLETIIDIEDQGFDSADKFRAQILYKKQNQNFGVKDFVLVPYDNGLLKTVPESIMPEIGNELLLLRLHDPIRRSNQFSLSYIDTLQINFIRNHHFKRPKIVYLNNKPIYLIEFKNALIVNKAEPRVSVIGEIYIDPKNWGIHKITYKAFFKQNPKKKIYELNLSYQPIDDRYYLSYISFNNFFQFTNVEKEFKIKMVEVAKNLKTDKAFYVKLIMNKYIDVKKAKPLKGTNYSLIYDNQNFKIDSVAIIEENIKLYSKTFSEIKTYTKEIPQKLKVNIIKDIYDIYGSKINERHFEDFYQYREFFVRNSFQEYDALDKTKLYNPNLPMLKNPVYFKHYSDTAWINTPLIKQNK